jgi:hypothetical protein
VPVIRLAQEGMLDDRRNVIRTSAHIGAGISQIVGGSRRTMPGACKAQQAALLRALAYRSRGRHALASGVKASRRIALPRRGRCKATPAFGLIIARL